MYVVRLPGISVNNVGFEAFVAVRMLMFWVFGAVQTRRQEPLVSELNLEAECFSDEFTRRQDPELKVSSVTTNHF